jgi:hypothetical protein
MSSQLRPPSGSARRRGGSAGRGGRPRPGARASCCARNARSRRPGCGRVVVAGGLGVREAVAPLPGRAAVLGGEDARGRDADPELRGSPGSGTIVCSTRPAAPGFQLVGRGVVGQRVDLPRFGRRPRCAGGARASCRRRACRGRGRATRSGTKSCRRAGRGAPADHRGEVGVVRGPVVHLPRVESATTAQVAPPSSERQTPAPCQSPPPPAQSVPVAGNRR